MSYESGWVIWHNRQVVDILFPIYKEEDTYIPDPVTWNDPTKYWLYDQKSQEKCLLYDNYCKAMTKVWNDATSQELLVVAINNKNVTSKHLSTIQVALGKTQIVGLEDPMPTSNYHGTPTDNASNNKVDDLSLSTDDVDGRGNEKNSEVHNNEKEPVNVDNNTYLPETLLYGNYDD